MPQPTPYVPSYSFTDFQTTNPSAPLPGTKADSEFGAVSITLSDILANLVLIQRDDGQLLNDIVTVDALNENVLLAIAAAVVTQAKGQDAQNPAFTFQATTLAPGSPATATVTGAYPNLTVALGIPKGDPSPGGANVIDADYGDVAVSGGGTEFTVQTVGGSVPFTVASPPSIADIPGLSDALNAPVAADWSTITGIPATFPPDPHNHDDLYYTKAETDAAYQPKGAYATSADIVGKADAITAVNSFSTSQVVADATHNGCYNKMTGGSNRTITFGAGPTAGHCSIWVNRGTVNMTVACAGGYWKNGAQNQSTINFSLTPGQKLTAFHEGGGDWAFEITG
jgi:hypothetical protein